MPAMVLRRFLNLFARIIGPEEIGNDIIIAVMGPAGAGKSTFINTAIRSAKMPVGHGLQVFTKDVRSVECAYPGDDKGRNVVFVDTPGINYDSSSPAEVEQLVKKWLARTTHVDGILYLYCISDFRLTESQSPVTYLGTFERLCGPEYAKKIVLVTTMWALSDMDRATRRESGLKIKWALKMERFEEPRIECAWRVVDSLLNCIPNLNRSSSRSSNSGEMPEGHIVIAVMGRNGSGKSSFINTAIGGDVPISSDLEPCTSEINVWKYHSERSDLDAIFIDTPGCGNQDQTIEVLEKISTWLKMSYKRNVKLAGILWVHRIVDNWVSPMRNVDIFNNVCGQDSFRKITFVTTMWDEHDEDDSTRWEKELQTKFWKPMTARGSKMTRYYNTPQSAWDILDDFVLASNLRCVDELQEEMSILQKRLCQSEAGVELFTRVKGLVGRQQGTVRQIRAGLAREQAESALNPLRYAHEQLRQLLQKAVAEVQSMGVPIGKHLRRISSTRLDPEGRATMIFAGEEPSEV